MVDSSALVHIPNSLLQSLPKLPEDLYPLSLTAFEKYLIWDESPQQPMNSFIELHFLDPIEVGVMEESIAAAMCIHPMFVCTVEERDCELQWVHQANFRHRLVQESESECMTKGDNRPIPINLFSEPGIRFWYVQGKQKESRILIQLHHAAADGVGLRRFLIDALTLYAHAAAPEKLVSSFRPPWSKVDLTLLKRRDDFSDTFDGPPAKPLTVWQRLKNAYFFHFQLPKPLRGSLSHRTSESNLGNSSRSQLERGSHTDSFQDSERKPEREAELSQADFRQPLEHLVIDRPMSEAILEKARISEIGVNELSLALLFETCSFWNQQHGDRNPRSRLRLLMPYDLRSRIDLRMPATNRLSFSFLGRTQADCRDLQKLIRSIGAEIQAMRESHLPLDFVNALEGASNYPKLMRLGIKNSRNMATAVLTYTGDISRGMQKYFPQQDGVRIVGHARLDKILAAPPARDNTNISLGLCINWGQLCISAAWNRDVLSRQQCQEFLQLYYTRWQIWLR